MTRTELIEALETAQGDFTEELARVLHEADEYVGKSWCDLPGYLKLNYRRRAQAILPILPRFIAAACLRAGGE